MADEQEHLEDGWQARDLRSGVAKVFQEAKQKCLIGLRAMLAWAIIVLVYAVLDTLGVSAVAPPIWELFAALLVMLMSALAMSRTPTPMLIAALIILADLIIVGYRAPELFERGTTREIAFTAVRVALAPAALSYVLMGYLGALSIQAFKRGFSPGQDWRTRLNPMMLTAVAVGSCVGAIGFGIAVWFGAISAGFAQPGALMTPQQPARIAAKADEEEESTFVLPFTTKEPEKPFQDYPEAAKPIDSLSGMDSFARREVEDAWEFAATATEAGCVDEAQGRQSRCRDERCIHWSQVFVRACLARTKKTDPKYCDGVPDPTTVVAGRVWAERLCAGRVFDLCREIMYAVQGHCHPPEEVAARTAAREAAEKNAAADKPAEGGAGKPPAAATNP